MFEFAKLTIESLKGHLGKPACQIDKSLLDYLHRTCLEVSFFTDRQKAVLSAVRESKQ